MAMFKLRLPVLTVIFSLCAAFGCLSGAVTGKVLLDQALTSAEPSCLLSVFIESLEYGLVDASVLVFLLAGLGAFLTLALYRRPIAAMVALMVPACFFSYTLYRFPTPEASDIVSLADERSAVFVGLVDKVDSESRLVVRTLFVRYPRREESISSGKCLVCLSPRLSALPVSKGDRLELKGKVRLLRRMNCYKQNIFCQVYCYSVRVWDGDSSDFTHKKELSVLPGSSDLFERPRQAIIEGHRRNLGDDLGDLLSSVVLGDRSVKLSSSIKEPFRITGLSHLLAASGFNLSILTGSVYLIASALSKNRVTVSIFALGATCGFVALAGASPSVVRAALMCGLLIASRFSCRRLHTGAALGATLILALIADPICIVDIGMQLSYAATASIVAGMGPLSLRFARFRQGRTVRWFVDCTLVIALAHAGVLPLQLFYFERLGFLFLPANLLVEPVIAPVTIVGFLSSTLYLLGSFLPILAMPLDAISASLDFLTNFPLRYMVSAASSLAALDWASIATGHIPVAAVVFYYITMVIFLACLRYASHCLLGLSGFVCGTLFLIVSGF